MQVTSHQNNERKIWENNQLKGYVDDEGVLFGINRNGHAIRVCEISHDAEIIPNLRKWQENAV